MPRVPAGCRDVSVYSIVDTLQLPHVEVTQPEHPHNTGKRLDIATILETNRKVEVRVENAGGADRHVAHDHECAPAQHGFKHWQDVATEPPQIEELVHEIEPTKPDKRREVDWMLAWPGLSVGEGAICGVYEGLAGGPLGRVLCVRRVDVVGG